MIHRRRVSVELRAGTCPAASGPGPHPAADPCAGCSLSGSRDTVLVGPRSRPDAGTTLPEPPLYRHADEEDNSASRRDFVREASAILAGVLVAGGFPGAVSALPVRWRTGERAGPDVVTLPVPSADGVTIDRQNELIVVRWQSKLYAFALSCPHQRSVLKWREGEALFQCTKHKSRYQPDGTFVSGRATRGMDRYPVTVSGGKLTVRLAEPILQDEDAAAWSAAAADLAD